MAEDIKIAEIKVRSIIKQALDEEKYQYQEPKPEEDYALKFSEKKDEYDNSWSLWVQPRIRKDAARLILRFRLDKIYCEIMQVDAINRELNAINREIFMGNFYLGQDLQIYFKISADFTFLELNVATMARWIALGNSSVSEYYDKLKSLAQRQNNG